MEEKNRIQLGQVLRTAREAKGMSSRQLEALVGIPAPTILRIEQGEFSSPAPDKLARIANALDVPLADVYAIAEYAAPKQLPNLSPYLRTKYRDLPDEAAAQIEAYARRLAKRHGVDLRGPAPGEDEQPEPTTTARRAASRTTTKATKTTKKPSKKGGTK